MCLRANMSEERGLFEILDETSEFEAQFARCRGLLRFVASRLLNGPEEIEEAVERCLRTASRYPMSFEYEGEFRSWLVRVRLMRHWRCGAGDASVRKQTYGGRQNTGQFQFKRAIRCDGRDLG